MRRREREPEPTVPDELATFDPDRWRGRGEVAGWIETRQGWAQVHGWPHDPVEMIREHVPAKLRTVQDLPRSPSVRKA